MRLSDLYPLLSTPERERLAKQAGISPGYLWQLSTRWKGKAASLDVIGKLCAAEPRLTVGDLANEFIEPHTDFVLRRG